MKRIHFMPCVKGRGSYEFRVTSFELRRSYEFRVTSFELMQSYEFRVMGFELNFHS
jgi:hypothetical protein